MKHVVSVDQFDKDLLKQLFFSATNLSKHFNEPSLRHHLLYKHTGKLMFNIFYEPSTRTRMSFDTAAQYMGLRVSTTENAEHSSSSSKGETLEDSIKVLNQYQPAAIVLRHFQTGAALRASKVSQAPIINAGDGKGEHPTQALLDAYTIYKKCGQLTDLKIVIGGDLKHGRTARSLVKLLAQYKGNHFSFVSTRALGMEPDILAVLDERGVSYSQSDDMKQAFSDADVVYWTRLQKERLDGLDIGSGGFVIDNQSLKELASHAIIMHPLPRVDEILPEIDSDERAFYFKQAGNGMFIRMALLDYILS